MIKALSVTEINSYIKDVISSDVFLSSVYITGEISNFTNHKKTGHFYFTIKDKKSSLKAIMFKGYAQKILFDIYDGMEVSIVGSIKVFERDANCQLYCEKIFPIGDGSLHLAFNQLKEKLEKNGYFDIEKKKPIPKYPKKICVITASTGAAIKDILNILSRRYPIAEVLVISTIVQGVMAEESISSSIIYANSIDDIDVIILGRGGGSSEDLWCFNSEKVAKEIFDSKIPIISAVGHETDFTISDFVSDIRASTPSEAAEISTPNKQDLLNYISSMEELLYYHIGKNYTDNKKSYKNINQRLLFLSPKNILKVKKENILSIEKFLYNNCKSNINKYINKFKENSLLLSALNPMSIILRGYSLSYMGDKILSSVDGVQEGDIIDIKLKDGNLRTKVLDNKFEI
ncbi:MAG: exodeoxyribonuclease VII large subunit [Oscillospiraceae bacterium]|nr:exodeoxyribonuclease VII large subunit [Oscillospiraceae bacterium]